ncbi:FAD binding domain-containing protein [Paenarthrobacter sp. Z7-10]|uniref:FAD binding domain-containing protein n=1 Tax=Paenarthrobacter sp. Z7-10 TaxID=2787635 RepID=UPI0022A9396C|nr:FAD binding domain-containing protein [Paenarthrobacter sp. Z7-10]MCZ2403849.1 FAD binding domain-containing protein [Paenarthrobacter sp. Z7-10]
MDMNTITAVVPTADPDQWRPGDAWLAGGTVLFSYGSSVLTRLLDISTAGWPAVTVTDDGIELAASATIAELYELPDRDGLLRRWPALELVRQCCDSFVASFKIWNMSTVGGNVCTALPAGPITSLCAALDGVATILMPGGGSRRVPVAELVIGDGRTSLRPGELLRSIFLPSAALSSRVAFRRLSLSNLGRSGVLLVGRRDKEGTLLITVTAATKRPVQLRFDAHPEGSDVPEPAAAVVVPPEPAAAVGRPDAAALRAALGAAIPADLYHDDIHGLPQWRRDMTYRLAEEIRAELLAEPAGRQPAQSPAGQPAGPSTGRGA